MRRNTLRLSLAAFTLVGFFGASLAAQETKSARGTVTAMAGDSISVKAGEREMKFVVDAKSVVTAEGAGTASREAAASGKSLKLADIVKVGDSVEVSYHETGGTMHAARIRKIPPVGAGGGGTSDDRPGSDTAMGTVESVSASSLTITGSAGGSGKFTQTFAIDTTTKVVATGAGTASAAAKEKGKSITATDVIGKGDQVTVTYSKKGDALIASQVRVTRKAVK